MKKAQSMSINTVIVAAIALIVLVVVIAILGTKIKDFTGGTKDCVTLGGEKCYADKCPSEEGGAVYVALPNSNCAKTEVCCKIVIPANNE